MPTGIALKRAYDPRSRSDGFRILVDRLWPRGLKKEALHLRLWAKELAPSDRLRKWFGHDPARWPEFQRRYREELTHMRASKRVGQILDAAKGSRTVTLVYAAKDADHNEAVVLRRLFESVARRRSRARARP